MDLEQSFENNEESKEEGQSHVILIAENIHQIEKAECQILKILYGNDKERNQIRND